jgi:hypothetical protein
MSNAAAELQQFTDDLLWGTQAIADYLGKSLTETQYLVRIKAIPVGRLGPKTIIASKRRLRQHINDKCASAMCSG